MSNILRHSLRVALAASLVSITVSSAHAQRERGPRWQGLYGCWAATGLGTAADAQLDARRVCITPTSDPDVADISTIEDGAVVNRERIDASGQVSPVDKDGCTGTQRAQWSADERRVYVRSSVSCGGIPREVSAILALTASGNWIDVRRVAERRGDTASANVRVARYADVGLSSAIPDSIAGTLRERGMSIAVGRIAATAPITSSAVVEAVRLADVAMAEAWVTESADLVALTSRDVRALVDSGVPDRVISAMSAAEESRRTFSPWPHWRGGGRGSHDPFGWPNDDAWDQGTGMRNALPQHATRPLYDPWGNGVWFYVPRSTLARYGVTMFAVDGDGFEYVPMPTYLFSYKRTVTGYVRPNVPVLRADPLAGGETPVAKSGPAARDVPDVVGDAVAAAAKGATKAEAPRSTPPPADRSAPSKTGSVKFPRS